MEIKQILINELEKNFSKIPELDPYQTTVHFDVGANESPKKMWIAYKYDEYIIAYEPIEGLWHALENNHVHLVGGFNSFNNAINAV